MNRMNFSQNFLQPCFLVSFCHRATSELCSAGCGKERTPISHTFDYPEQSRVAVDVSMYNLDVKPYETTDKVLPVAATFQVAIYDVHNSFRIIQVGRDLQRLPSATSHSKEIKLKKVTFLYKGYEIFGSSEQLVPVFDQILWYFFSFFLQLLEISYVSTSYVSIT